VANRKKPGDKLYAWSLAKKRIGRHRKKESRYNTLRVSIRDFEPTTPGLQYEQALIHEIMDLLPYANKEEALKELLTAAEDGRTLRKIKRLLKGKLPGLNGD